MWLDLEEKSSWRAAPHGAICKSACFEMVFQKQSFLWFKVFTSTDARR